MKTTDLIICDDHAIFRDGIKSTLSGQQNVQVVAEAENGIQCLEQIAEFNPDVILLDINMPEMDGIECLKQIKILHPHIKVIALTQYNEKRFVKQMLKQGAHGYVLKSTSRKELLVAIHEVLNGRIYLAEDAKNTAQNLAIEGDINTLFPDLGEREKEIIKMLCDEQSSKQIADSLCLSHHTVESHRANIFKKVGVSNIAGLVKWAVYNGFD